MTSSFQVFPPQYTGQVNNNPNPINNCLFSLVFHTIILSQNIVLFQISVTNSPLELLGKLLLVEESKAIPNNFGETPNFLYASKTLMMCPDLYNTWVNQEEILNK